MSKINLKQSKAKESNKSKSDPSSSHDGSSDQMDKVPIKDTKLGSNTQLRHFVFEMIGTAILGFGIACTQYAPPLKQKIANPFHNICISLSLYLAICLFSPFCPAHYNPSVSLAFCCKNIIQTRSKLKMRKNEVQSQMENQNFSPLIQRQENQNYISKNIKSFILKTVGQFLGAFIGLLLAYLIYDSVVGPYDDMPPGPTLFTQVFGEIIGTFFFVFFIMMVTSQMTTFITEDSWVHIFIPLSLYCGRTFSFHVCGLNPAIVMMAQIVKMMRTSDAVASGLVSAIIVSLGSLLGGYLAAIFFTRFYNLSIRAWRENSGQ